MESGKLIGWFQLGANISVLAGLGLVALQISQNSELVRQQLLNDQLALLVAKENAVAGENPAVAWAKAIEDPSELSLEEMRVMEALYYRTYMEYVHLYENRDFYDDEWKKRVKREGGWFLQSEFGHAWWEENRQWLEHAELRDAIDVEVRESDSGQSDYFQRLRNRIDQFE